MKVCVMSANRYGGDLPNQSWPTPPSSYDRRSGEASLDEALGLAALADDLGFDWITCSEHHYTALVQAPNACLYAAALCGVVKRAKIGIMGPLLPLNNPVRLAEELAQLDQLSKGRIVFMPLRGTANEFLSYGVNPDETRAMTQEATMLIARALREKEPFGWQGKYYQYRTISVWPGPSQEQIPVFYSGNSTDSVEFAAANRFAFAASFYPPHVCAQMTAMYRAACERHGWQPAPDQFLYRSYAAVADSEEEAERLQVKFFERDITAGLWTGRGATVANQSPWEMPKPLQEAVGFGLGRLLFCGTPDQVVEQIREFHAQTGIGVLDLAFASMGLNQAETTKSMTLFAKEVLPRIRSIGDQHWTPSKDDARVVQAA